MAETHSEEAEAVAVAVLEGTVSVEVVLLPQPLVADSQLLWPEVKVQVKPQPEEVSARALAAKSAGMARKDFIVAR